MGATALGASVVPTGLTMRGAVGPADGRERVEDGRSIVACVEVEAHRELHRQTSTRRKASPRVGKTNVAPTAAPCFAHGLMRAER